MKKYTPDFVYQQAYDNLARERANIHYIPTQHGTPWQTSALHLPLFPPYHRATLTMTFQGTFVQAKISYTTDIKGKRARRGTITSFSHASRVRLLDLFHKLNVRRMAIFLTLTYPETYETASASKHHLRAFFKRLERLHPNARIAAIWRMEFQERGAPHFHCMFFGLPFTAKEKIQAMWGEIIGFEKPFTRIEGILSQRKLVNYVSKYIAKVPDAGNSGFNSLTYLSAYQALHGEQIGRVWGYLNKSDIPFADLEVIELPYRTAQFEPFRRFAIALFPRIADYLTPGFRLYVKSADAILKRFHVLHDLPFIT